ncbi:MAG: hypothetical protein E6Q95_04905 [Chitinophagaceae bacterium]|nr:MAG: hypothetical protein E6Q95_04905 [Chitinophagaceae bacterium]
MILQRLFFLVLFFVSYQAYSQIPAPDLYCVKGDTVHWDLPVVNCGAVQSYELYYALNYFGPYQLLASISDINQTEFIFNSSPGGIIYYYMTTNASCSGLSSLSSDTLDIASPLPVAIKEFTVNGNDILSSWSKGNSPETLAYFIFKGLGNGVVHALDTVTTLNFTDYNRNTSNSSYTYYIVALDRCGGTSIFSDPHSTILLSGNIDTCQKKINLQFNEYMGWSGKTSYVLLQSIDNGLEVPLDTSQNATFDIPDLQDDKEYCFRIRAISEDMLQVSYSNVLCFHSRISKTITSLCVFDIENRFDNSNMDSLVITFKTNQDIPIQSLYLKESKDIATIATMQEVAIPVFNNKVSLASTGEVTYYQFISLDVCGNRVESEIFSNLIVNAMLRPDNSVDISWNSMEWGNGTVVEYVIERINTSIDKKVIGTVGNDELEYTDHLIVEKDNQTRYCYQVSGKVESSCNKNQRIEVLSNIVCVEKTAGAYMANAFIPGGNFAEFKPIFYFSESIADYEMLIFDRYGNKVYTTNNPEKGWNGNKLNQSNQPMPNGVYSYYVRIKSGNGSEQILKGGLTLIR